MSEQHTPGPWYWDEGERNNDMPRLMSQDGHVCDFGNNEQYYPTEGVPPNVADSRLIAAAPDLLEGVRGILNLLDYGVNGSKGLTQTLAEARAALAKATGGAA